ncbi:hypothetical protein Lser_V15G32307 [Lactuca serriola]
MYRSAQAIQHHPNNAKRQTKDSIARSSKRLQAQFMSKRKKEKRKQDEEKKKAEVVALYKFIHRQPIEEHVEEHTEEHVEEQQHIEVEDAEEQEPAKELVDIYDPRRWEKLNSEEIKLLVQKGPKRDNKKGFQKGNWMVKVMQIGTMLPLGLTVKEHEISLDHLTNWNKWSDMRKRLNLNETIDKVQYEQFKKERDYWKQVLL